MKQGKIKNRNRNNPYKLGFDESRNTYTVEFKDSRKITHIVEITEKVYEAFDLFELEDISQENKFRRHIEHSEIYEETLNKKMLRKPKNLEEEIEEKIILEEVKKAISNLSEVKKRRIKMYYFDEKTLEEIAEIERPTHQAISKSIRQGIEEIRKNIKN